MWYASQYGEGRHLRQISFFWFYCFAYFARDFVRSNLSAFVRSSPCTMPNIGGGVERTSPELRLRRPGRWLPFLEYSRRCWHGYSWGGSAYLRAAPPHTCILVLSSKHTTVSVFPLLFHLPTGYGRRHGLLCFSSRSVHGDCHIVRLPASLLWEA